MHFAYWRMIAHRAFALECAQAWMFALTDLTLTLLVSFSAESHTWPLLGWALLV